jgi:hypothetical protein
LFSPPLELFSITLNRHCEFSTGLRPTPMDETDFGGVVLVWW